MQMTSEEPWNNIRRIRERKEQMGGGKQEPEKNMEQNKDNTNL